LHPNPRQCVFECGFISHLDSEIKKHELTHANMAGQYGRLEHVPSNVNRTDMPQKAVSTDRRCPICQSLFFTATCQCRRLLRGGEEPKQDRRAGGKASDGFNNERSDFADLSDYMEKVGSEEHEDKAAGFRHLLRLAERPTGPAQLLEAEALPLIKGALEASFNDEDGLGGGGLAGLARLKLQLSIVGLALALAQAEAAQRPMMEDAGEDDGGLAGMLLRAVREGRSGGVRRKAGEAMRFLGSQPASAEALFRAGATPALLGAAGGVRGAAVARAHALHSRFTRYGVFEAREKKKGAGAGGGGDGDDDGDGGGGSGGD
jgi:hypothetical protein